MRSSLVRARTMLLAIAMLAVVLPVTDAGANGGYTATIRRTEYGIPHIKAEGWGNHGFGVG